jgi:hypothetical protein
VDLEKAYEAYLTLTSSLSPHIEMEWMPFLYPVFYARGIGTLDLNAAPFPAGLYIRDLRYLVEAIGHSAIIILDECDLLAKPIGIMQEMRNIFMTLDKYMLVLAGTPALFPSMDEVFSPIVRQFKRIEGREFIAFADSLECIRKPLETIPDVEIDELLERTNVGDIHELTSGRPYEIQLLCHTSPTKRLVSHDV